MRGVCYQHGETLHAPYAHALPLKPIPLAKAAAANKGVSWHLATVKHATLHRTRQSNLDVLALVNMPTDL